MLRFTNKNELNGYWSDARETHFHLLEAYQKVHSPGFSSYFLLLRFLKALSNRLALASSLGISDLKSSIASVDSGLGQRMAEDEKQKVTEDERGNSK